MEPTSKEGIQRGHYRVGLVPKLPGGADMHGTLDIVGSFIQKFLGQRDKRGGHSGQAGG